MTLEEFRPLIGRRVVYLPSRRLHLGQLESGTITSVGDAFVFVRYGADLGSKATNAEDLELEQAKDPTCPDCGGMGEYDVDIIVGGCDHDTETVECPTCGGTGNAPPEKIATDEGAGG